MILKKRLKILYIHKILNLKESKLKKKYDNIYEKFKEIYHDEEDC